MNSKMNNSTKTPNKPIRPLRKTLIGLCSLAILQTAFVGCSETLSTKNEKVRSSGHVTVLDESAWANETEQFGDSGLIKSKVLTPAGKEKATAILRETTLESLNLPSYLNVNAFTVRSKGNVRTKQAIYFAPKLYFYQKADRAHVKAKQVGDNVLIPLHAILVDGLSENVPSSDGISTIKLPPSYLVNINAIKNAMAERNYDPDVSFGPLDGCPQSFKITVANATFDVTPESLKDGDQCNINRPFTLNLVVPKSQADYIINEALYYHQLDASVTFQVKVGYVDADVRIQLDRSKIFEKLQVSLSGKKPPYAQVDVKATIQKVIQNETFNLFIKGDRTDVVNQLIQAAYDSFVIPFELKPGQTAPPECAATAAVCVNISYEKNTENRNLEISYQQYSTTLAGQNVISTAKPQQILFPEVVFQSSDDTKGAYIDNRENQQNERNLLVTLNPKSIVEIEMFGTKAQIDDSEQSVNLSISSNGGCVERDYTNRCKRSVYNTYVGRSYSGPKMTEAKAAAGNLIGQPGAQLFLKFVKSDGEVVRCSFNQMSATGLGDRYIIKIQNSPGCLIFADENNKNEQVSASFINELRDSKTAMVIGDGNPFNYTDHTSLQDGTPPHDGSHLGGSQPKILTEAVRAILLEIKVYVRKYDLTQYN